MDVREKLVELLLKEDDVCKPNECKNCGANGSCYYHRAANRIIANGVTVQECGHWEDEHGDYVCSCCHTVFTDDLVWLVRGESNEPNYCPNCGAKMMPQPPKGE